MVTDVDESLWFGGFGSFGWLLLFVGFLFSFSFFPLFSLQDLVIFVVLKAPLFLKI